MPRARQEEERATHAVSFVGMRAALPLASRHLPLRRSSISTCLAGGFSSTPAPSPGSCTPRGRRGLPPPASFWRECHPRPSPAARLGRALCRGPGPPPGSRGEVQHPRGVALCGTRLCWDRIQNQGHDIQGLLTSSRYPICGSLPRSSLASAATTTSSKADTGVMAEPGVPAGTPGVAEEAAGVAGVASEWAVEERVELNAKEQEIFESLLGTVQMFGLKTQLRVAGGWVRDKLLGRESIDIDIALDDLPGREFADKVNQYLESKGQVARGVGVIKSNPEQSKHLETATMMIHGQWIDLVNLRAESYAEGSRIPSAMEFGSAEEDAYRRDLTINSMFYNISTGQVEDLTKQGIQDLKKGIVRTPLPPMQTFLDDPLRVLRAVRFASRFGFSMDSELKAAASSPEVREALIHKVSRERVGKEVEGMLKGRDPCGAMELLHFLGLFSVVFTLPGTGGPGPLEGLPREHQKEGVESLREAHRLMRCRADIFGGEQVDDLAVATRLAAVLLPLRHCTYPDKKQKPVPVCQFIIRESLKLKASYADTVCNLHTYAEGFNALVHLLTSGNQDPPSEGPSFAASPRVQAGKFLWKEAKGTWRSALLLCAVLGEGHTCADSSTASGDGVSIQKRARTGQTGSDGLAPWEVQCVQAAEAVVHLGLDGVWERKPLLNGKDVMALLGFKGPQTKVWLDKALEWELAHPLGDADSCKQWLLKEKEQVQ